MPETKEIPSLKDKIKCIIVDDESFAIKLLVAYVEKIDRLELVGTCQSGAEAYNMLQEQQVDLMFLDVQMPDLTGLELLRSLKTRPMVVLTTAYAKFAVESFELDVIDYLVKPFSFERFLHAVDKAAEHHKLLIEHELYNEAESNTKEKSQSPQDHIYVKADHKLLKVQFDDILFIESQRDYAAIQTKEKKFLIKQSLTALDNLLPASHFRRVHRSFIISTSKIDAVYGNVIEIGTHEVTIGKSYKEDFYKFIQALK